MMYEYEVHLEQLLLEWRIAINNITREKEKERK